MLLTKSQIITTFQKTKTITTFQLRTEVALNSHKNHWPLTNDCVISCRVWRHRWELNFFLNKCYHHHASFNFRPLSHLHSFDLNKFNNAVFWLIVKAEFRTVNLNMKLLNDLFKLGLRWILCVSLIYSQK